MGRSGSKTSYWPMLVAPAMAVCLIALVVWLRPVQDRLMVNDWRDRLATYDDSQVAAAFDQLLVIGDASIPVLTELLGSERASVAEAARRTLLDETERWMLLPADDEATKLALLAAALAQHVDKFGPAARGLAARLTQQILLRPFDSPSVDSVQLLAHCDAVLIHVAARNPQPERYWPQAVFNPLGEVEPTGRRAADNAALVESDLGQRAPVPGGGLPVETAQVPKLPTVQTVGPQTAAQSNGLPKLLPTPPAGTLPIRSPQPPGLLPDWRDARRNRSGVGHLQTGGASHLRTTDSARAMARNTLRAGHAADLRSPLAKQKPLTLMRSLHDINQATAQAAIRELKRRGLSETELRLARDLTHPDPSVRRQLVDALATVAGINARPWLLVLATDLDAEVRLAALSSMATSSDHQLVSHAEELARHDEDPRITALAKRLAERRRKRSSE